MKIHSDYDFDERDIRKVSFIEFSNYSRPKKREYLSHMRDYYGYSIEDLAKELGTNVGSIRVWAERVGCFFFDKNDDRQIRSRKNLIFERTVSVIGPDAPAVRLCYE